MKLHLIATGGTIACLPQNGLLSPALNAADLLSHVDAGGHSVSCTDLFSMDSSNIQPEEWQSIARCIHDVKDRVGGVVITHGTDTMAYTSSMLTFLLRHIEIPVVLTGAQYPIAYPDTDGKKNLQDAITAAARLSGGIYVCFGGAIIMGCRAVKTRTTSLAAFESINYPYIGTIVNGSCYPLFTPPERGAYHFDEALEPRVALIKLIPGTSPAFIESAACCGMRGVVVEAFGLGGVHSFRRDHAQSIKKLIDAGIPVVLSSQCLYEASSPDLYEVSRPLKEAGVIPAYDMTTEAAVTKLMWVLGKTDDMDEVRAEMLTDYCGEIRG